MAQARGRPTTGSPEPADHRAGKRLPPPPCPTYFELGPGGLPATAPTTTTFTVPATAAGWTTASPRSIEWASRQRLRPRDLPDANGDGDLDDANEDNEPENEPLASAASGTTVEQTTIGPDPAPGKYVARVVNYAGGRPTTSTSPSRARSRSSRHDGELDAHLRDAGGRGRADASSC